MLDLAIIKQAASIIRKGGLVAFPTETVYGLGANAFDEEACLKIYKAKGRPSNNPLIVHISSVEQAKELAVFNDKANLLSRLWPGPLTMVLPKRADAKLANCVTAGLDTVAIRVPAHSTARELILQSGLPIAAPSANKSGRLSPTSHEHVKANFAGGEIFVINSDKPLEYGLESTIIDLSNSVPTILRFGFITPELIEQILDTKVNVATTSSEVKAPGMMYLHYAPKTILRINAEFLEENEVGLNFGNSNLVAKGSLNLSAEGDLAVAAANLFAYLHILDNYAQQNSIKSIAVAKIPNESTGLAINDRLSRACKKN